MVNRILRREEMTYPVTYYEENSFLIVVLNGNEILDKTAFFKEMETKMQFPGTCKNKFSRFDDWMTDLSWISADQGICLIVNNYSKFLSLDPVFKENLIEDFRDNILPFWEKDVLQYVKDGKTRRFDMILN
jgi:hypothetical protein